MRVLLVLIGLLAVVFLVHIFMPPDDKRPATALQVVPNDASKTNLVSENGPEQQLRPVPDPQMTVIKDVFAPELEN